ncbi:hemolysin family protein [Cryptosporangium aurantiacum]|uniref:Hemolysin, contains CBS domains n=1 Tax=Cryptosporangium aurantiacum TaxID=134849 RepID=A0A1M7RD01_9ACTN|nr:hemolysin family protein [Cryptosporangium aurantiacum]SHN44096.1 Hemolysin, contains CBS domains [Cryptosporangium aurantiacum]
MNTLALAVTFLLLLGNAFFVGGEFALIASRRTQLEPMAALGSRRAAAALRAMNQIPLMIAGAQLGITICSLGLGAIAEPTLAHLLESPFHSLGVPDDLLHPIAFVLALAIVVFLHTVLGEMVPKNIALAGPEKAVLWLGAPMLWFAQATKPILVALKWISRTLLGAIGIESHDAVKTVYTADELASLVAESRTEGLLDAEDHKRITGALSLTEKTAGIVAVPWPQVDTVNQEISPAALEVLATRVRRSRFPVVDRVSREILGFVHVKDVLGMSGAERRAPLPPAKIRTLKAVPPSTTLADLLVLMRRERVHFVLVTDGVTPVGVVTLDDVLHAVFGEEATAV